MLELHRVETTTSASKLKARLQVTPVEDFPENYNIFEQLAHQVSDSDPQQWPR
jgi:hypothetical protein